MPIYTYQCDECGVRFDVRQKFTDEPISVCPECGGHTHRVPQPVGIVFKGSGWYVKDSKGSNQLAVPGKRQDKQEAKPDTGTDKPTPSTSATSADAKSTKKNTTPKDAK